MKLICTQTSRSPSVRLSVRPSVWELNTLSNELETFGCTRNKAAVLYSISKRLLTLIWERRFEEWDGLEGESDGNRRGGEREDARKEKRGWIKTEKGAFESLNNDSSKNRISQLCNKTTSLTNRTVTRWTQVYEATIRRALPSSSADSCWSSTARLRLRLSTCHCTSLCERHTTNKSVFISRNIFTTVRQTATEDRRQYV